MPRAPLRLLGLDPGSRRTGFGIIEPAPGGRAVLVAAGVVSAPPKGEPHLRLAAIHRRLGEIIRTHRPDEMAVEGVFSAKNAATAIMLGQARGVALLAAAQAGLPVAEYPPATVKKTLVGNGRAQKEQVRLMVAATLGDGRDLPLDASDALAIAICHMQLRRMKALGVI